MQIIVTKPATAFSFTLGAIVKKKKNQLNRLTDIKTIGIITDQRADFLPTRQPNASYFNFLATAQKKLNSFAPHIGTFGFATAHKPTQRQNQKSQFCQRKKTHSASNTIKDKRKNISSSKIIIVADY